MKKSLNFYKILCIATSGLFIYLFYLLFFDSVSFLRGLGLEASEATSVLARRTSMFMLGISVLMFSARNLPNSKERQIICLATGITLFGLACMGTYEFIIGSVNSSIFTAIIVETILWISFGIILFTKKKTP